MDFIEFDVGDELQAPIDTCSLGVGECQGKLLELRDMEEEEASVSRLALVDARSVARRRLELEAEEAIVGMVWVVCIVSVVSLLAMESLRIRAVGKRPRMLEARSLLEESGSGLRVRPAGKRRSSSMICVLPSETMF